jgi:UDP-N-acetylglucosamine 1-carboxyvinyltransferase
MASDIRAGAAILIAALAAQGSSEISRIYHIDRGYEHPEQKLLQIGARIRRVSA